MNTRQDLDSKLSLTLPTPTLLTILHLRDRYGCDAITNEDALHFPSKSIPDMEVAGGGCHPISLKFHGVPPFVVDYTFAEPGKSETVLKEEFSDFSVFLSNVGTYNFLSVADSYCKRQFSRSTRSVLQTPTAELEIPKSNFKVCEIEARFPKDEQLNVILYGMNNNYKN